MIGTPGFLLPGSNQAGVLIAVSNLVYKMDLLFCAKRGMNTNPEMQDYE